MIGLYKELEKREKAFNPVNIGLIGAGQMGTDVIAETSIMKGIEVIAACDIDLQKARDAYRIGKINDDVDETTTPEKADRLIESGRKIITRDYRVVTDMHNIDVVLEATGVPEIGTQVALRTIRNRKHLSMMNVETDITVGPLLKWYAEKNGVVYSLAAGDEPSACKELYDFALALGFTIVAAGKGKNNPLDIHAKPTDEKWTQEASRRGLTPNMLIEFIDGSKTMIEMASLSNATGLVPDIRGMHGQNTNYEELNKVFSLKRDGGILHKMGVVEYGIGKIAPGVFVVFSTEHPRLREALILRNMGTGPYYTLFRPYHLCSIEVPLSCALQVIHKRSNMAPLDRLVSEVFATSKQELHTGDVLDGIGGSTFYSIIDTYEIAKKEGLLAIGLAKGACMIHSLPIDTPITYNDVELHEPSTILDLRRLQDAWMSHEIDEEGLLKAIDILVNN